MPTTKTISHIGDTKFEVIKDTYDAFKFTVDDKSASPNSPKTVMYISSEAATAAVPTPLSTTGRITMSNTRTEGATSTSSADVDHDVGIGGKILIREGTGAGTATRAAIYAEKDATANNHRLIIDPYKEDDADNSDSTNNGTVYIRGNLIVEGDKTILDTAEHITSENLLGINAVKDSSGNTTGGAATTAGIHVYSGSTDTQFLYNFGTSRWRTARTNQTLKDLEAKDVFAEKLTATGTSHLSAVDINGGNIDGTIIGASVAAAATFTALTATGTSTLTNVDINGGNIDGTIIGASVAAAATFTSFTASGTSTLTNVDINGGNIDGTAIGDTVASTAKFTSLDASGTSTLSTVDINGGNIDGTVIGAATAAAATFTALTATGTSTLTNVDINGGNIDGTAIGDTVAATAKFTTLDASGAVNFASTLGVTGALSGTSGSFSGNVTAATFTGNLTGSVTGQVSSIANHTTNNLSEGNINLYYTDARARAAISLAANESLLQYDNVTGILSTNLSAGGLAGLGDVTLTSVADHDFLRYDTASSKWVNSNSLIIKDTSYADPFGTGTASIVTEGGMIINSQQDVINSTAALFVAGGAFINKTLGCGGEFRASHTELGPFTVSKRDAAMSDPDYHSIIFTDNRSSGGDTTHKIFDVAWSTDTSGSTVYKRNLGDDTIHVVARGVSARTIGNIVPVELTASGGRTSTKTISATATAVPLHDDILSYYSTKTFAAGQCVVALTDGTNSSVAMFSFSKCGSILTMVLDQEVHSSSAALNVDYDSTGTIDLNLGTATSAIYCVKVLPVMTSDSITEQF